MIPGENGSDTLVLWDLPPLGRPPFLKYFLKCYDAWLFLCLLQAVLQTLLNLSCFIFKLAEFKLTTTWRALGFQGPRGMPNLSHLQT